MRTFLAALALLLVLAAPAGAQTPTSFPPGFPVIPDASTGIPVIGFGGSGPVERTPVILLHANNDTPYPTACNPFYGNMRALAMYLRAQGYRPGELWALGYQGEQCDILTTPTIRSGEERWTVANVPDLRRFVAAVLAYTGASRVDIVGHSLGATLAREWMRQDNAYALVRRLVSVDGPNHGIINCSPNPLNFYALAVNGGFTPDSAICLEYGAADTPFLLRLNADETPGPTQYLAIRNADTSFVFISRQDGVLPAVPAENRRGEPHDFSESARLGGVRTRNVDLIDQGRYDRLLGTAHLGILGSSETWALVYDFLSEGGDEGPSEDRDEDDDDDRSED